MDTEFSPCQSPMNLCVYPRGTPPRNEQNSCGFPTFCINSTTLSPFCTPLTFRQGLTEGDERLFWTASIADAAQRPRLPLMRELSAARLTEGEKRTALFASPPASLTLSSTLPPLRLSFGQTPLPAGESLALGRGGQGAEDIRPSSPETFDRTCRGGNSPPATPQHLVVVI